jgi:hypothetical protein
MLVNMVAVPEELAQPLRETLRRIVFGSVGASIVALPSSGQPDHASVALVTRFYVAGELLNSMGWDGRLAPVRVEVDLGCCGALLLEGLRAIQIGCLQERAFPGMLKWRRASSAVSPAVLNDFLVLVRERMGWSAVEAVSCGDERSDPIFVDAAWWKSQVHGDLPQLVGPGVCPASF